MSQKKWKILYKQKQSNLDSIVDILLKNRDIVNSKKFFRPQNPMQISLKEFGISQSQVKKALLRLKKAKKNNECIVIFGDYDADGVCAATILWKSLNSDSFKVFPYLPNRFTDGYGLSAGVVEKIKNTYPDVGLIITVDNGIVAQKGIQEANKLGIDVIVTDHHEKNDSVPSAVAIVHTTKICGSAVSWVFAREVIAYFEITKIKADDLLDLAAIGTTADQMPLIGVNRSIAKFGLACLRQTKSAGIAYLLESANIKNRNLGAYEVGYVIAPRINAMGRMGDPMDALRLLCTSNKQRITLLGNNLSQANTQRQNVLEEAFVHALAAASTLQEHSVLVVASETYHEGIIGLAAGRLVEKFSKPSIVISKGEIYSKGSARSFPGIHITNILRQLSDLLEDVGGHEMAAGFTIKNENIEEFTKKLQEVSKIDLPKETLIKEMIIDMPISFLAINWELTEKLSAFEPFGLKNPQPIFESENVTIIEAKKMGQDGKHLKLKIKEENKIFDAVAFSKADEWSINSGEKLNIVFSIEVNEWNGNQSIQFKIKDIHKI